MANSSAGAVRGADRSGLLALVVLTLLVALIFHRSFSPNYVVFANDSPLGALNAQANYPMSGFSGSWQHLNWVGIHEPSAVPNITQALFIVLGPTFWGERGPVLYAKFYTPVAILLLGLAAWFLCRRLRLHPAACVLGGIAAMLSTDPFSYAAWGLASIPLAMASIFFALGMLVSTRDGRTWIKVALAGGAVGMSIMEGYDVGAILSLYVAAFAVFLSLIEDGSPAAKRVARGIFRVAITAVCAAILAASALTTLIGTQVKGVAGMKQDTESRQQRWDTATMWSLPKLETLRVIVPGLFGYRMDSPDGGNYWGAVAQQKGMPTTRHSGSGVYVGVLVALLALFASAQSLRGAKSIFTPFERRVVWFFMGAAAISLLLAFGRHAPFYQFFYGLPYFSTIRNPIKFMHPFSMAMAVLFAFGVHALFRQCVVVAGSREALGQRLRSWWRGAEPFERRWTKVSVGVVGVSALGYLLYASSRSELLRHLAAAGFPGAQGEAIARFSATELLWFVFFLAASVGIVLLVFSRWLAGSRAVWAAVLLGAVLVTDMARANAPWVVYVDYADKYSTNGLIELLRKNTHEQRVTARLLPLGGGGMVTSKEGQALPYVAYEWLQHHFQYYRIQSLDIIQMPRVPEFDLTYLTAFAPAPGAPLNPALVLRLWQLTNTRLLLAQRDFLSFLNEHFDSAQRRFKEVAAFEILAKPGRDPSQSLPPEELTAELRPDGRYALIEFAGALPRAKLFTSWVTITIDASALQMLTSPGFDPNARVIVSGSLTPSPEVAPTNASAATVSITSYAPKRIQLTANANGPSILLLNDKFHPGWKVSVNGQPREMLRCNYIMRGVQLDAGTHQVEFRFEPGIGALNVSLTALVVALGLCGFLIADGFRKKVSVS